jgi:predicted PurR-regulated permease PerM
MAWPEASPERLENPVPPAGTPSTPAMTTLLVGVVVVAALYVGREVLIPIALAILLSFVLAPLVLRLRQLRVPKVPAVILSVLLALGIVLGLGSVIGSQVANLATELPRYETTISKKLGHLRRLTVDRVAQLITTVSRQVDPRERVDGAGPPQDGSVGPPLPAPQQPMLVEVKERDPTPVELAERYLAPLIHPLTTLGIIFVVAVFMLVQQEDLRDRMIRLFGASDLHRTTAAIDDAGRRLSRYFLLQLCLNSILGVIITAGLWVIGVPSPILWGVLAALMRFVPYVGGFISAALPVTLAAAVDPGWGMAMATVGLFVVMEALMGQVVEPLVYGHSTGLSPTAVVVAAIFWTWLWGPIGLILSTPLTLCLVVLGRYVERFEFLDVLLGDRPALSPAENFYQRILAGDPDEALDYAERLLKERSLSTYYDEVALKGLQLAANDLQRGVLDRAQLENVKAAIRGVVRDLESYDDREPSKAEKPSEPVVAPEDEANLPSGPPPSSSAEGIELRPEWRGEAPILCVAGRGQLDEAASEMLAQLLRKHGLGARVVPHEAASREGIATLDPTGIAMICISYLEIAGNPAHLRYLLRRMRQRFKGAPILVGLWPAEDAILTDDKLKKEVGADHYTLSLRQAVEVCLSLATQADEAPPPAEPERKAGASRVPA